MGRGLPRKYAKMGFSKGWKAYKESKTYKERTTTNKVVGVKKVTKRRYRRRAKRRRPKRKISLEVAVALGSIPFVPAKSGWGSIFQHAQEGYIDLVGQDLAQGFLGFNTKTGQFNLMATLNPFDMEAARFSKMIILAGLLSKLRKSAVRIPFDKIPFIGKYIS